MTLKSFVLGIFFRIARKICFRYFKSKIWQKIWKCSGFAVFFQGIFLKSNVYKNEENALFLLCFFKISFLKSDFYKNEENALFLLCFFLSNLFKNIFSFERFDLKNTTKIELFLLFCKNLIKKDTWSRSKKYMVWLTCTIERRQSARLTIEEYHFDLQDWRHCGAAAGGPQVTPHGFKCVKCTIWLLFKKHSFVFEKIPATWSQLSWL